MTLSWWHCYEIVSVTFTLNTLLRNYSGDMWQLTYANKRRYLGEVVDKTGRVWQRMLLLLLLLLLGGGGLVSRHRSSESSEFAQRHCIYNIDNKTSSHVITEFPINVSKKIKSKSFEILQNFWYFYKVQWFTRICKKSASFYARESSARYQCITREFGDISLGSLAKYHLRVWRDITREFSEISFESLARYHQWRHFNFFLGGANFFFIFRCHQTIEKLEKKQHFICSNLTLFIVPFFLSLFFLLFFSFFFFFFFLFFLFSFSLGGDGPPLQPPSNDASGYHLRVWRDITREFGEISFESLARYNSVVWRDINREFGEISLETRERVWCYLTSWNIWLIRNWTWFKRLQIENARYFIQKAGFEWIKIRPHVHGSEASCLRTNELVEVCRSAQVPIWLFECQRSGTRSTLEWQRWRWRRVWRWQWWRHQLATGFWEMTWGIFRTVLLSTSG